MPNDMEMHERQLEGQWEGFLEDQGLPQKPKLRGPAQILGFNGLGYDNATALKGALADREKNLHNELTKMEQERADEKAAALAKVDEELRQAKQAEQDKHEAAVNDYRASLDQLLVGPALDRALQDAEADASEKRQRILIRGDGSLADIRRIGANLREEIARLRAEGAQQQEALQALDEAHDRKVAELEAAAGEEKEDIQQQYKDVPERIKDARKRLDAVKKYREERADALENLRYLNEPEVDALTVPDVKKVSVYLSMAEYKDWITRAETLRWFQLDYWWSWRGAMVLAGVVLLVLLTWASWPQQSAGELFGRMIGIVVFLIVPLASILFRAVRALARE